MKYSIFQTSSVFLILFTCIILSCSKSKSSQHSINCNSLTTDTLGTGDKGKVYMPNAFTPNNDGINDACKVYSINIASITFTIYDKDNNVVFATSKLGESWQPTASSDNPAKYYYTIQAITTEGHKIGKCGEVYLLTCKPQNTAATFYFGDQLRADGFTGISSENLPSCL